jgi:sialic acid synthase SpsE
MKHPAVQFSDRVISAADRCYIIAEIGVNHNGSLELAHRLIDEAADSGADAVKFQTFFAEDLLMEDTPKAEYQKLTTDFGDQNEMLRALELSESDFIGLKRHCDEIGIDFMSTAFDEKSLAIVSRLAPVCLKWPSGELNNFILLRQAAKINLPIILSTGMGSISEVSEAVETLRTNGCDDIVVLQCVSQYPARIEEQNLRAMANMSPILGVPVGLSDHTIGPYAAIAARALGMSVLEKHFTLDTSMRGPDHAASIEPEEFKSLVSILRQIEIGLGDGIKRPTNDEVAMQKVVRKSLVYRENFPAGHTISEIDIVAKRPGSGIAPNQVDHFYGKTLKYDVKAGDLVTYAHVN